MVLEALLAGPLQLQEQGVNSRTPAGLSGLKETVDTGHGCLAQVQITRSDEAAAQTALKFEASTWHQPRPVAQKITEVLREVVFEPHPVPGEEFVGLVTAGGRSPDCTEIRIAPENAPLAFRGLIDPEINPQGQNRLPDKAPRERGRRLPSPDAKSKSQSKSKSGAWGRGGCWAGAALLIQRLRSQGF
jgi:hypothetical protein